MAIGWRANTAAGSGDATSIQTVPVSATPPTPGQVLTYSGTEWAPATPGAAAAYSKTLWVDPAGNALAAGDNPAAPTTLAVALASIPANGCVVLAAGDYGAATVGTTCTLVGVEAAQPTTSHAAVRFTGTLTITAPNVQVVGVLLLAGLTDNSAAAGATRVTECAVVGPTAVNSPAASQALEFHRSDFGAVTIGGASGGFTLFCKGCKLGASVTHTATGATILSLENSTLAGAVTVNNAAGSVAVTLDHSSVGAMTRTAGTFSSVLLLAARVGSVGTPAPLDLTGAGANTFIAVDSLFDRAGSTIPVGVEKTGVVRGWPHEYSPTTPGDWSIVPTEVSGALDTLAASVAKPKREAITFGWNANRNPGTVIPTGNFTPNTTPGAAQGVAWLASTIRELTWRRTGGAGVIDIVVVRNLNVFSTTSVAISAAVAGASVGLSIPVAAADEPLVMWGSASPGAITNISFTLHLELA